MSDRDKSPGSPRPAPPSKEDFKAAVEQALRNAPLFNAYVDALHEAGFSLWAWCPTCGSGVGASRHGQECPASVYPGALPTAAEKARRHGYSAPDYPKDGLCTICNKRRDDGIHY